MTEIRKYRRTGRLRPAYDLIDLVLFSHVARRRSLTAGAADAALSLAAASARISKLELAVGTKLFDRTAAGLVLTADGHALDIAAARVLFEMRHLEDGLQAAAEASSGHIRIAANVLAARDILPDILAPFMARMPGVTVELDESVSRRIPKLVQQAQADFGVVIGTISAGSGLELLPFGSIAWALVVSPNHPLATCGTVSLADALSFPFIDRTTEGSVFRVLESLARARGIELNVRARMASFEGMCRLAADNVGVAVVPSRTAARLARVMDIVVVDVGDSWARRSMLLCHRRDWAMPAYARALLDVLTSSADK